MRHKIFIVLLLLTLIVVGCSSNDEDGVSGTNGGKADGDKPYAGTTLNMLLLQDPFYEPLVNAIPDFEEETGIEVNIEGMQYGSLHNKLVLDVAGGPGLYDVIGIDNMWTGEFAEGEFVLPLNELIEQDKDEIDPDDFPKPTWDTFSWKGETYGVPFSPYTKMLLYRKDLWEDEDNQKEFESKYGYTLKEPDTWEEYKNIAEFFTGDWGDGKQHYGVAFNAKKGPSIVAMFFAYADNFGAKWFESYPEEPWDFTPTINSPVMKEALQYYVDLMEYAPPEVTDFEWFDTGGAFWNGQVAMMDHWSVYASMASDPDMSSIVGNLGAALPPAINEDVRSSQLGGWSLGISSRSDEPEAAWEFVKWATSKETMLKMSTENMFDAVSRESVISDPEYQERYPWAPVYLEALKKANPDYKPRIPAYVEIEEVLGVELNNAITGVKSPDEALDDAQEDIVKIVEKARLLE